MIARNFRHRVEFRAFRDVGVGVSDSKREFSEPITCYAKIDATSPKRLIDDVNAFGNDRAVTHMVTMRARDDIDAFTYMVWCGRWYRIVQSQVSDDQRFMSIGVIYERKAQQETLTRSVFAS